MLGANRCTGSLRYDIKGASPHLETGNESAKLESFPNPAPQRDYTLHMEIPEFTCLCPRTGQPDFATLKLQYVPDSKCVELKSLKQYIVSWRNIGSFHEAACNRVADDLIALLNPRFLRLSALFGIRGGISTEVVVEHAMPDWTAKQNKAR